MNLLSLSQRIMASLRLLTPESRQRPTAQPEREGEGHRAEQASLRLRGHRERLTSSIESSPATSPASSIAGLEASVNPTGIGRSSRAIQPAVQERPAAHFQPQPAPQPGSSSGIVGTSSCAANFKMSCLFMSFTMLFMLFCTR